MEIMKKFALGMAYTLGVLASCGPSQIYGLIAGTVKLIQLAKVKGQISKINDLATNVIINGNRNTKLNKLNIQYSDLKEGLKQSGRCLVPIVGVIWAMHHLPPPASDDINNV
ncbi:MAG: hypothetical protein JSR37_00425 [Verrucomicrobia bacterium]|nr:hypothetical protein [Verrucomicrobiota bacterium]